MTNKDLAIEVIDVDKTFRIASDPLHSLKQFFLNPAKLFKGTQKFDALSDVSFSVEKGDFVGIIGTNGSGKSTLLKIMAGIYLPDKGKVKMHGKVVPFLELGVGFNPELPARDNIFLNGTILGMSRKYLAQKFDEIIAFAELEKFVDVPIKNFSSGMQLRLAFSIAIMSSADIYLMDEVLAVGDSAFQAKCLNVFEKYQKEGKTVVLVSHDLATMQKMCSKLILIDKGKLIKIGPPAEIIELYLDRSAVPHVKGHGEEELVHGNQKSDKKVRIINAEFMDKNRKIKDTFKTGDDMIIRLNISKLTTDLTNINAGIALFDINNNYLFGINTFVDKPDIKKYKDQSYFEMKYKNIPLRSNLFFVKAAVWQDSEDELYDFMERSQTFRVVSDDGYQGSLNIDHEWL